MPRNIHFPVGREFLYGLFLRAVVIKLFKINIRKIFQIVHSNNRISFFNNKNLNIIPGILSSIPIICSFYSLLLITHTTSRFQENKKNPVLAGTQNTPHYTFHANTESADLINFILNKKKKRQRALQRRKEQTSLHF